MVCEDFGFQSHIILPASSSFLCNENYEVEFLISNRKSF